MIVGGHMKKKVASKGLVVSQGVVPPSSVVVAPNVKLMQNVSSRGASAIQFSNVIKSKSDSFVFNADDGVGEPPPPMQTVVSVASGEHKVLYTNGGGVGPMSPLTISTTLAGTPASTAGWSLPTNAASIGINMAAVPGGGTSVGVPTTQQNLLTTLVSPLTQGSNASSLSGSTQSPPMIYNGSPHVATGTVHHYPPQPELYARKQNETTPKKKAPPRRKKSTESTDSERSPATTGVPKPRRRSKTIKTNEPEEDIEEKVDALVKNIYSKFKEIEAQKASQGSQSNSAKKPSSGGSKPKTSQNSGKTPQSQGKTTAPIQAPIQHTVNIGGQLTNVTLNPGQITSVTLPSGQIAKIAMPPIMSSGAQLSATSAASHLSTVAIGQSDLGIITNPTSLQLNASTPNKSMGSVIPSSVSMFPSSVYNLPQLMQASSALTQTSSAVSGILTNQMNNTLVTATTLNTPMLATGNHMVVKPVTVPSSPAVTRVTSTIQVHSTVPSNSNTIPARSTTLPPLNATLPQIVTTIPALNATLPSSGLTTMATPHMTLPATMPAIITNPIINPAFAGQTTTKTVTPPKQAPKRSRSSSQEKADNKPKRSRSKKKPEDTNSDVASLSSLLDIANQQYFSNMFPNGLPGSALPNVSYQANFNVIAGAKESTEISKTESAGHAVIIRKTIPKISTPGGSKIPAGAIPAENIFRPNRDLVAEPNRGLLTPTSQLISATTLTPETLTSAGAQGQAESWQQVIQTGNTAALSSNLTLNRSAAPAANHASPVSSLLESAAIASTLKTFHDTELQQLNDLDDILGHSGAIDQKLDLDSKLEHTDNIDITLENHFPGALSQMDSGSIEKLKESLYYKQQEQFNTLYQAEHTLPNGSVQSVIKLDPFLDTKLNTLDKSDTKLFGLDTFGMGGQLDSEAAELKLKWDLEDRLKMNLEEEIPKCSCIEGDFDEVRDGPYYTHLGAGSSVVEIRAIMESRLSLNGRALRIEKVLYTGKEGKSTQGCPIAKWIIRRSGPEEKVLVIVRPRKGHHCSTAVIVIGIVLWEGVSEPVADDLYDQCSSVLPTSGYETERRCGLNEERTCACQGWDGETGGASFSFGCSWSMYYNGCKFAKGLKPRKFKLKDQTKENELEEKLQNLATDLAPVYKQTAPEAYKNMTHFEDLAGDCRLGFKPGRPFTGVTSVMDFCSHAHKDVHNMNNGCTTVVTLTKHRGPAKPDEDEQLHVLPLCVMDTTDEFGSMEGQYEKVQNGSIEYLTKFPQTMRIRGSPLPTCKERKRIRIERRKAKARQSLKLGKGARIMKAKPEVSSISWAKRIFKVPDGGKFRMTPDGKKVKIKSSFYTPKHVPGFMSEQGIGGHDKLPGFFARYAESVGVKPLQSDSEMEASNAAEQKNQNGNTTKSKESREKKIKSPPSYQEAMKGKRIPFSGKIGQYAQYSQQQRYQTWQNWYKHELQHRSKDKQISKWWVGHKKGRKCEANENAHPQVNGADVKDEKSNNNEHTFVVPEKIPARQNSQLNSNQSPADQALKSQSTVSEQKQQLYKQNIESSSLPSFNKTFMTTNQTSRPADDQNQEKNGGKNGGAASGGSYYSQLAQRFQQSAKQVQPSENHSPQCMEDVDPMVGAKEVTTNNEHNFIDSDIGGVAIALSHGSVLFEVAKKELHATTAMKNPDRTQPTRISLVFYQHKGLNKPSHGHHEYQLKSVEWQKRRQEKLKVEKLRETGVIPSPGPLSKRLKSANGDSKSKGKKKGNKKKKPLYKAAPYRYMWDASINHSTTHTTSTVCTKWCKPQPAVTGPYQRWL